MKIRTLAVSGGLAVVLLASACATSISGQALPNPAAVISTSVDTPTSLTTTTAETSSSQPTLESTTATTTDPTTTDETTGDLTTTSSTSRSTRSSTQGGVTSVPGFSADCNQVLAGVQAFGTLLSDASSGSASAKVTKAQVDKALESLPASGLPAEAQANVNILRAAAIAAEGKTLIDLGLALQNGKVVAAIQDLGTWITKNCT